MEKVRSALGNLWYQGTTRVNRTFALQIMFSLLYFLSLELTFSAPLGGAVCLRKIVRLRLIPREQVSEGLFLPLSQGARGNQ